MRNSRFEASEEKLCREKRQLVAAAQMAGDPAMKSGSQLAIVPEQCLEDIEDIIAQVRSGCEEVYTYIPKIDAMKCQRINLNY